MLLSINTLFENLKRRARKQHKPHKQNTCFCHEPTLHKGAKTTANTGKSWSTQSILNLFIASSSSHWITMSMQAVQTFKFPIRLTGQKWKNTLQKRHTRDVVFSPNGSTTQRALEQIALISWHKKYVEVIERVLPQRSHPGLLAHQSSWWHNKCVWPNHVGTALPSSAIHRSLRYLHGTH